ncbi:MAG: T9SS type A sorting domain-containing protein [Flavobacteriaceae bacterium]|nr:T9SS type A sorting domain-containing protein [Flavobacteriaceae bacterium]
MNKLLLVLLLTLSSLISAQNIQEMGAHQQQSLEFGNIKKFTAEFDKSEKSIVPINTKSTKTLSKIVFGFLPYWEYANGAHNNIHYDLLTHIAVFDFQVSASGSISYPDGWPWTDVINTAHAQNVKIIMAITNFIADDIHTLLTSSSSKNTFFNNIKNIITNYQLDGVNIDFENINSADRGTLLNTFMADLTNYIHNNIPGSEVSFDSPAVNWGGWDLNELCNSVDYLFIMGYDYNGSWSDYTGAVAPLTNTSGGICVTKSLDNDYSQPIANFPEKLILGVPYYGKHWETSSSVANAPVTNYMGSTLYRDTADEVNTYGGYIWDNNSQTSWYCWNSSGWNQVWADNEQSLNLKYDLAINKNLGGIGIWALNYDGNKNELWDLIANKFDSALLISDHDIEKHLKLYPNPVKDDLYILTPAQFNITRIEVFTSYGQKIMDCPVMNNPIDLHNLSNSIYFIKISDDSNIALTYKIIKL